MKQLNLRTGDKVEWSVGLLGSTLMVGVVLEDLNNGLVEIISHTKNGQPCSLIIFVEKVKLKLHH